MSGFVTCQGDIHLILLVVTLENKTCILNLITFKGNPIFLLNNIMTFWKKILVLIASPPITCNFCPLFVLSIFEPYKIDISIDLDLFVCYVPLSW